MLPLSDIRVIAVEQFGAGPFGSMQLADLGATVVKIEDPTTGGDVGRQVPPHAEAGDSLYFEAVNRNKQSFALDLRNPAGREVFLDLVRGADAVYSNLRGDVPERLGIRYADLADVNPGIVCCSLSGFGMTGPRVRQPAYDPILQGLAGWMSLTGEPGSPPERSGLSMVDYCGGFVAALSLLAGVHAARRDGVGTDCDVSLFDTSVSLLTYLATWHLSRGDRPQRSRRSAHPSLVPFQTFRTRDGWLVIACAKEKFWTRLLPVVGREDLGSDSRFATFAERSRHREELEGILEAAFLTRDCADWIERLTDAGVPCAPTNDVTAALADDQTAARGLLVSTEHPRFGELRHVNSAVRVGPVRTAHSRAPQLGEHTERILRDVLGYDTERIARLTERGAFGAAPGSPAPQ